MKSVQLFKQEKYNFQTKNVFAAGIINSFDGKQYICHTSHKKLLKGNIPCQVIWSNLQVFHLHDELAELRKLEKAIISRRVLFKKILIFYLAGQYFI